MSRITEEDPATKAAREAEEATAAAAKAAEEAAAAAKAAEDEAAAAKAKAAEEEAARAAALAAAQAKKEKGEELSDEELALLEAGTPTPEDEGVVVLIGDEPPPSNEDDKSAPQWVKDLRKDHREQARRLRELEEENKKLRAPAAAAPQSAGAKPTLEGCDYDEDKFEKALTAWHDAKRKEDDAIAAKKASEAAEQAAWQKKLSGYKEDKTKFDAADFVEAETLVTTKLNVTQQGIIIQGADNPRLVVYALGKNPKKAEELAAITDPLQFAFAVAKLETQMKIAPKKSPPPPDKPLNGGSASLAGGIDSQLETLRTEAERTGDYTKVNKYKSDKRKAEQAKA